MAERKTQADVDRQVAALARAWHADGVKAPVVLVRDGRLYRLTLSGYTVTEWPNASTGEVWSALLDMRRAVETARTVRERIA